MTLFYPNATVLTTPQPESKAGYVLTKTDIFKFVPTPQLHPVSTWFSRIGSIIIVLILIGYFAYDLYLFLARNIPVTNSFAKSNVDAGAFSIPEIGFALLYYNKSNNYTGTLLNNSQILNLTFQAHIRKQSGLYNNKIASITVPLISGSSKFPVSYCVDIQYLKNAMSSANYTFVNDQNQLMLQTNSTETQEAQYVQYKLYISQCSGNNCSFFISSIIAQSVLEIYLKQPSGYDYQKGTPIFPNSVSMYQYPISTSSQNRIQLSYQPTKFQKLPNLLTTFKQKQEVYTRMNEAVSLVSPNPLGFIATITLVPSQIMNRVVIAPKTSIEALAIWFSFSKMVITIAVIIFVGFNRKRFHKLNPEWKRFDALLESKVKNEDTNIIQMTNMNSANKTPNERNENNQYVGSPQPMTDIRYSLTANQHQKYEI